jgi:hypothetical protein
MEQGTAHPPASIWKRPFQDYCVSNAPAWERGLKRNFLSNNRFSSQTGVGMKTYLFEFLVHPNNKDKMRPIYIKAQSPGAEIDEKALRRAAGAIAAHDIPEMKPLDANPGRLVETNDEESPVQYLRHNDHPGVIVWESNRGPTQSQ